MKLNIAIRTLLLLGTGANASLLRRREQSTCSDCCTTIEALDFPTIDLCDTNHIKNRIGATKGDCSHNNNEEAKKLAGKTNQNEAYDDLIELCRSKIVSCVDPDALFESFPTILNCQEGTIKNEIGELKPDDCDRSKVEEGIAMAPVEYRIWSDKNEETPNAKDYWMSECEDVITPCASLDALLEKFVSIPSCKKGKIEADIQDLQEDLPCSRNKAWDGVLLAQELLLRDNSDGEVELPTVWSSNNPDVVTGFTVLNEKCESLITPCAAASSLHMSFEAIERCEDSFILNDITAHQADWCRRSAQDDAILLTPDDRTIWGDSKNTTLDARVLLAHECSQRVKPAYSLAVLEADFVDIPICDWNSIKSVISSNQPNDGKRDANEEAFYLAGDMLKQGDSDILITTFMGTRFDELQSENPEYDYVSMSFGDQEGTIDPEWLLTGKCNDLIQSCVEDFEQFHSGFTQLEWCASDKILTLIGDNQKDDCSRGEKKDGRILARDYEILENPDVEPPVFNWGGNVPELNAELYLKDKCFENIESCVPNSELDFSDVLICDGKHIKNLITDSQADGCDRTPENDARLIVRDLTSTPENPRPEPLPWSHSDKDDAVTYLKALCHDGARSCVGDYDKLNFEDLRLCKDDHILNEITANQGEECARQNTHDATMLVREKVISDNGPDYEAPVYVWKDSDETTHDARDYLYDDCMSRITPCSTIDDLDFPNIRTCSKGNIEKEILAKQEGCPSDRSPTQDGMIMTGTEMWSSNDPEVITASSILIGVCETEITPCLSLDSLDFSDINDCGNNNIINLIDNTREAMGAQCPSYGSRTAQEEAILVTGADVYNDDDPATVNAKDILIDACLARVESCTLRNGASLEVDGCDYVNFKAAVKEANKDEDNDCNRNFDFELYALERELLEQTGVTAEELIDSACTVAWGTVETSTFSDVDAEFTDAFMGDYVDGQTHLNLDTGNFQGNCVEDRDGEIGANISAFRMDQAYKTRVEGFAELESCQGQAIMCCFGRDRQFGDNNGNCKIDDCEDADPADNSNLCKTDTRAYPNDDPPENDIHCHGLAWGAEENDFSRKLAFNNFFYVSLYDHMYTRGYVERTIPDDPDDFRMCDCLENMPPVSRSDCTEVVINPFTVTRSNDGASVTATAPDSLDVEFNACVGVGRSNDLSTHITRLVRDGRMSEGVQQAAWETLVGYDDPNNNNNEAACQAIL